jgi:hypothetical protein
MKGSYGSYVLYTNERGTEKVNRKVHQKTERTGQEGPKLTALLSCAARDRSAIMMTGAMRSALAMLSRRSCGSLGSSAAASVATRGLEIRQVVGAAAPRIPLLLHPAAVRNLEVRRLCFRYGPF